MFLSGIIILQKVTKNSNKLFGGHVVIAGVNITSNYKISNNLEFSIEG